MQASRRQGRRMAGGANATTAGSTSAHGHPRWKSERCALFFLSSQGAFL